MKKMQRKWHVGKDWSVNFSMFIVYMYMHLAWYVQYSDWRRCVAIATRLCYCCSVLCATVALLWVFVPHSQEEGLSGRRWDEDYVLKQTLSALVPAFDPRPGRTNVPQIQDFEVPPPGVEHRASNIDHPTLPPANSIKLAMTIRVSQSCSARLLSVSLCLLFCC